MTCSPENLTSSTGGQLKYKYFATGHFTQCDQIFVRHGFNTSNSTSASQERRQILLKRNFRPLCKCHLCQDLSEFHSFIFAVTCQTCRYKNIKNEDYPEEPLRVILPTNPLDSSIYWQCNACQDPVIGEDIFNLVNRAREASHEYVSRYMNDIEGYVGRLFDLNGTSESNDEEMNAVGTSPYNDEEMNLEYFYKYIQINNQLERSECKRLHPNHYIYCQEKFTSMWAFYVFLLTNRDSKYSPKSVTLNGRTIHFPSQTYFVANPIHCRQVSEDLQKLSRNLLEIVSKFADSDSVPCGIMYYMMVFSGWMIIMDNVKKYENYDIFLSDITEWCVMKRRADGFILLAEQEDQGEHWAGCAEWLTRMDCVDVSKHPDINCRHLFNSLLK